jgi:uncharacterized protein (TIGR03118 family)
MFVRVSSWLPRCAKLSASNCGRRLSRRPVRCRPALESLEERSLLSTFVQTKLVSDQAGQALFKDTSLINPWGIAIGPGPVWLSDNGSGLSAFYNGQGQSAGQVTIPGTAPVQPTGIVFNGGGNFDVSEPSGTPGSSFFLFATQDGRILGWNPTVNATQAVQAVDNPNASYTGLTLGSDGARGQLLYAANFTQVRIDVFDSTFQPVTLSQTAFTDPKLPQGYWPFNIQELGGHLYVAYALNDPNNNGEGKPGAGDGVVDEYTNDGKFVQRLVSNGPKSPLNAPWGLALAPAGFGSYGGDLLVGNFGDGHINVFSPKGGFIAPLTIDNGQTFQENQLWGLAFGNGNAANGPATTLFFTAGPGDEAHGLFGSIAVPPHLTGNSVLAKLPTAVTQTVPTDTASGDNNPYGLAFVPQGYTGGGELQAGDLLVSNFNSSSGLQGTGTTIQLVTPTGQVSTFFQGPSGLGLTTALGVLKSGFVIVGSVPNDGNGNPLQGSLLIINSNGQIVATLTGSPLLDGPWDLAVNDRGKTAQVFVSNVLSGTVTRINLSIAAGSAPLVDSETEIAAGYTHGTDPNAFVLGPTGLAYQASTNTLFVASTADNAIYAIANAATSTGGHTKGRLIVQNEAHLHGPLGLVIAPNGDIIVANGDAVAAGGTANDLVEYNPAGHFVAQFQVDSGNPGAAFGLALSTANGVLRFATVDDDPSATFTNSNTVSIFTLAL